VVRRRLDAELVRRGLVESRSRAAAAIAEGRVLVGGAPARSPSHQVAAGEPVTVAGPPARFVSRGGDKLAGALDAFAVDVDGLRCLDVGASTGGFTDCLLQRGAAEVVAVDVGRGQLAWTLRSDERVRLLERTNARDLTADRIGGPAHLVTADVSFISLRTVAPALARCAAPGAAFVLLVKPQFEAGPARIGKRGVVRDRAVHEAVLTEVVEGLAAAGIGVVALAVSSPRGSEGNVEFFAHARLGAPTVEPAEIAAVVEVAHATDDGGAG
jgi:23S rRNA (cytidine1920-2'-O)/16S rRNA (cytidine1409-2'-O)-methyltransferase